MSYVKTQINIADDQHVEIDFTAGRGANGLSATIDVRNTKATETKPESKPVTHSAPKAVEEPIKEEATAQEEPKKEETSAPKGKLFGGSKTVKTDIIGDTDTEDDDAPDAVEDKLPPRESIFGKKTA